MPVPPFENYFINENKIASGQQYALIFFPGLPVVFLMEKR